MEKQTNINTHSFCAKKWQVLFPTGFHFKVVVTLDYGVYMYLKQIISTVHDGHESHTQVDFFLLCTGETAWA